MVRRRPGFTLFELVLVLAVMVVVAAISYPSIDSVFNSYKVGTGADAVRAGWAKARAQAMNDGIPYRFSVMPNTGNFRIAPDLPDFWGGNGSSPDSMDPANPPFIFENIVPKGVRLNPGNRSAGGTAGDDGGRTILPPDSIDPANWITIAVFLPDGTARDNACLRLDCKGARSIQLELRGLTGAVKNRQL
jgi:prepilin-type N-terminal cleavage/methylation domain-containing protein